jgi:hypothetical protein
MASIQCPNTHRGVGLFCEPIQDRDGIRSIGLATERRDVRTPNNHRVQPKPIPLHPFSLADRYGSHWFIHACVSKTVLQNMQFLEVQYVHLDKDHSRCIGLLIGYPSGRLETLGQWNPAGSDNQHVIWNVEQDGPLEQLTFVYSSEQDEGQDGHTRYVEEIITTQPPPASAEKLVFTWQPCDKVSWCGRACLNGD